MAWATTQSALLAAIFVGFAAACVGDTATSERPIGEENAGSIELALSWGDRNFSVVEYRIETEGGELYLDGVIDISEADFYVTKYIDGIGPGRYMMRLESLSDDGARVCRGSSDFTVSVRETSSVTMLLLCSATRNSGAVSIEAQFDDCTGAIGGVIVEPLIAEVGETMSLVVHPQPGFGPIEWSATSGAIDYPGAPEAQYTCTEIGLHTITVTVHSADAELCDPDTRDVRVECRGAPAP